MCCCCCFWYPLISYKNAHNRCCYCHVITLLIDVIWLNWFKKNYKAYSRLVVSFVGTNVPHGYKSSSAFYTHKKRTSTMLVKKIVKMHSVACEHSVKQVYSLLFTFFFYISYTPKEKFTYIITYIYISIMIFSAWWNTAILHYAKNSQLFL